MQRIAFKMQLLPGNREEYKKRHDEIWPELKHALKKSGISDYSIFLDTETDTLFATHLVSENFNAEEIPGIEIVKKWWAMMSDIMITNEDNSPKTGVLNEVFYMK